MNATKTTVARQLQRTGFRQVHGTTGGGVDVGGVMLAAGGGGGQVVRVGFWRLR